MLTPQLLYMMSLIRVLENVGSGYFSEFDSHAEVRISIELTSNNWHGIQCRALRIHNSNQRHIFRPSCTACAYANLDSNIESLTHTVMWRGHKVIKHYTMTLTSNHNVNQHLLPAYLLAKRHILIDNLSCLIHNAFSIANSHSRSLLCIV